MEKFGKSSSGLLRIKRGFFDENDAYLAEARTFARIYSEQPPRSACKNCAAALGGDSFSHMGVTYVLCERCGHLNGAHEDTDAFCQAIYLDAGGENYAKAYHESDQAAIEHRLEFIYRPKRDFLFDSLRDDGLDPQQCSYAELGSGSGYFLKTLAEAGVEGFIGHEVSAAQVAFAAELVGAERCRQNGPAENVEIIEHLTCDVLVMLGVLEHVQQPRDILAAIAANDSIRYLYLAVPMFSPSVFFENAFPGVMPRVLTGGHTHLYTDSSLDWLANEFGFERSAEWWFGTDMFDLYRAVSVLIDKACGSADLLDHWERNFADVIDDLQFVLDRKKRSSQAHIVFRKR